MDRSRFSESPPAASLAQSHAPSSPWSTQNHNRWKRGYRRRCRRFRLTSRNQHSKQWNTWPCSSAGSTAALEPGKSSLPTPKANYPCAASCGESPEFFVAKSPRPRASRRRPLRKVKLTLRRNLNGFRSKPPRPDPARESQAYEDSHEDRSRPHQHRWQIKQNRRHHHRIGRNTLQPVMQRQFQLVSGAPVQTENLRLRLRSKRNGNRNRFDLPRQSIELRLLLFNLPSHFA